MTAATLPRPGDGLPPYGILSDGVIGDVVGKQARQVCVERVRRGFPAVTQRHRERQWFALRDLWGVEAAERFLARSPRLLAEFRAAVSPRAKPVPMRPFVTVPRTAPEEMSAAWKGPANPEAHAAKYAPNGQRETVEEFLARGGTVTRVPSCQVTPETLLALAKLREGFPKAGP